MNNIDAINEAAENFRKNSEGFDYPKEAIYKFGALSDAAKQYWYEQISAEDVKRWYQLLVGKGEDVMKQDIKNSKV